MAFPEIGFPADLNYQTVDIPGANATTVRGINNFGQIVGTYDNHGFLMSGSTLTPVDPPNSVQTIPTAINDAGQIVGYYLTSFATVGEQPFYHGFILDTGGFTTIDVPNAVSTQLTGINNSKQIVGFYINPGVHSFLFNNGILSPVNVPILGASNTVALAINNQGQIVGQYIDPDGNTGRGFVLSGSAIETVGIQVEAINDTGDLVFIGAGGSRFVRTGIVVEGIVIPNSFRVSPAGLNDPGQIVGLYLDNVTLSTHGFIGTRQMLSAPTNLRATQLGFGGAQIVLTWNYGTDPVDGFVIQSKIPSNGDGPNSWSPPMVASLSNSCSSSSNGGASLTCTYIDTNVLPFFTTSYRVSAYTGSTTNSSPFSNTATAYQLKECGLPPLRTDCKNFTNTGTDIQADFAPDPSLSSVHAAAQMLPPDTSQKFDHFNWLSYVEHWPQCYLNAPLLHFAAHTTSSSDHNLQFPIQGLPVTNVGQVDPPLGGYWEYYLGGYGLSDQLPFAYNEQTAWFPNPTISLNADFDISSSSAGGPQSNSNIASFYDQPDLPCLPGNPPDYLGFITYLVGITSPVGTVPSMFTVLNGFAWNTTFNSAEGGIRTASAKPSVLGGSGGVFNVTALDVTNLPPYLRQQLAQTGALGLTNSSYVDMSAPATSAFLSGPQGTHGSYVGPVTVTLIATDIDGPTDIAATYYKIDGGAAITYSNAFSVVSNGAHNIEFFSVDMAGNVETPATSLTITIGLKPATVTLAPNSLSQTYDGLPKPSTATTDPPGLTVSLTYNGSPTPPTSVGTYTVIATITDPNYQALTSGGTLTINRGVPAITWPSPAAVSFGSALGSGQLNATANIPGGFVYSPPVGTVLSAGNNQTLSVTFTPSDTMDYSTATASTTINVNPAPPTAANLVITKVLTRSGGNIVVQLTIANTGGTAAANVMLTSLKVATTSGTPLPQTIGTIGPGASVQVTVTEPGSVGASGTTSTLTVNGTYTGGTFSSSARITLP
jgi:hypothetical protein